MDWNDVKLTSDQENYVMHEAEMYVLEDLKNRFCKCDGCRICIAPAITTYNREAYLFCDDSNHQTKLPIDYEF